jgi:hypothetical protein
MNTVLTVLGKIFSKENRQFILIAALVVVCMLWFKSCSKQSQLKEEAERQQKIADQNQRALTDSLRFVKNKAGDIEAIKSSFVAKLSDLEKLNKDLYKESKKEIGELKALVKSSIGAGVEGVVISNELKRYPDGNTIGLLFKDTRADSGMVWHIDGESKFKFENNTIFPGTTTINSNTMKLKIVLGFKENKENYEVFARSASPNVTFDDLSGVMFIPKKADPLLTPPVRNKKFGLGIHIGYGIGFMNKQVMLTPYVGVGLSYNLIKF